MIKILKSGDTIYENLKEKVLNILEINEYGEPIKFEEIPNPIIPSNFETLKNCAINTIKWQAGLKLKETDWVVTKIAEMQVTGGDVEAAKEKYADVLTERENIRAKSNELEEKVNSRTTYEELLEVVKDLRVNV